MLHGLHRLAGTDGHAIDGELEPCLQRIRRERLVEAVHAVKVVIGLLHIFAMETGLGYLGIDGDGDAGIRRLRRWLACKAPWSRRGGGDVPVTGTGGAHGDALDLDGNVAGVGEVGGDAEGLAGDGGGEGILRIDGEAGAATIGVGRSDDGGERDPERLHNGAVELRLLYRELVQDVVFFLGRRDWRRLLFASVTVFVSYRRRAGGPAWPAARGEGAGGLVDGWRRSDAGRR